MDLLMRFLEFTAKEMSPPKAYGTFHLLFWSIGLLLSFLIAFLLRKTKEKADKYLLFGIGIFLLLAEIYKQLFYTFYIGKGNYQFDRIPFQLCSMSMYLCLIAPWLKQGRLKQTLYTFIASFGFMGGFVSYFSPESMCLNYWALTLHSFTWHMLLIFLGLYLFFTGRAGKGLKDFPPVIGMYLVFCLMAFSINLACYHCPGKDVNMFNLGPKPSQLVICRDIVKKFGWQVNAVVYMSALIVCAFLFYAVYLLVRHKVMQKRKAGTS